MGLLFVASSAVGCTQNERAEWDRMANAWRSDPATETEETWTIECNEYTAADHRRMADKMATLLKRVPELDADAVRIEHNEDRSRVFYGVYVLSYKRAKVDRKSQVKGDLVIQLSEEIKRDLGFIRQLAWGEHYPFFQARPLQKPVKESGGRREWDLRHAHGHYTLHIGVTYNTPTMHDYKEAAYQWVADLRKRGYEAYYCHDADRPQTSICLGTFGSDAYVQDRDGNMVYTAKVNALRDRETEFQYNLENGHIQYKRTVDPKTRKVERTPNLSFLARIPRSQHTLNR
jgi:hypothetical protein